MVDTAIEQRDEHVAQAIVSGQSLRMVRKEFGLSIAELDAVLERLWPIDAQARLRLIKRDVGRIDRLLEVFFERSLRGDVQSGLLTVRIWERLHELLGMNSAAKIEIVQAPSEAPTRYEKITEAIMRLTGGPDRQPFQPKRLNGGLPPDPDDDPDEPEPLIGG